MLIYLYASHHLDVFQKAQDSWVRVVGGGFQTSNESLKRLLEVPVDGEKHTAMTTDPLRSLSLGSAINIENLCRS